MNHDFICYIIISTIKIPHRLKNNFRYNYIVILYNNIIFRFSFQIRCSDEHTPRSGSEKIHFFLLQIPHWFLHSVLFFFLFFFIFFFFQYVTNTLEMSPRHLCLFFFFFYYYRVFSFVISSPCINDDFQDEKIHFFHRSWCKGTVSSVSFLSFSFFSSFCLFFKYFALFARWPAFSAIFTFFFFFSFLSSFFLSFLFFI